MMTVHPSKTTREELAGTLLAQVSSHQNTFEADPAFMVKVNGLAAMLRAEAEKIRPRQSHVESAEPNLRPSRWVREGMANSAGRPITTLMLCNIPCNYSIKDMAHMINELGFGGMYDWLHVLTGGKVKRPSGNKSNLGYGFINFRRPEDAEAFGHAFTGVHFAGTASQKRGMVKPAQLQGFENTIELFQKSIRKRSFRGEMLCTI